MFEKKYTWVFSVWLLIQGKGLHYYGTFTYAKWYLFCQVWHKCMCFYRKLLWFCNVVLGCTTSAIETSSFNLFYTLKPCSQKRHCKTMAMCSKNTQVGSHSDQHFIVPFLGCNGPHPSHKAPLLSRKVVRVAKKWGKVTDFCTKWICTKYFDFFPAQIMEEHYKFPPPCFAHANWPCGKNIMPFTAIFYCILPFSR